MMEAIKSAGEYALRWCCRNIDNMDDQIYILAEDINTDTHMLFINLKKKADRYQYRNISLEEYSSDRRLNYLYRRGSSSGINMTPGAKVAGNIEKTFENKIVRWFKKKCRQIDSGEDRDFLERINKCLQENKKEILDGLKDQEYGDNPVFISLKIDNKYIGQYDVFKRILINEAKSSFYIKYNTESRSKSQLCSICGEKSEVYGFVSTYGFYTLDKPGFVSGGFRQSDAWKNYPVCWKCALLMEAGKSYLDKYMQFNFYEIPYIMIPKFITTDKKLQKEIFRKIEQWKDPRFDRTTVTRLTDDEEEIFKLLAEENNYLNLNLLFYRKDRSEFKILLYIEDILPSRLEKMFKEKEKVDKLSIFKENKTEFNFGCVKHFFPDNKYFLDIAGKIFTNRYINYDFIMHFIMKKIRGRYRKGENIRESTIKAFLFLNYLNYLGILDKRGKYMDKASDNSDEGTTVAKEGLRERIDRFFSEHKDFFDNHAKKAVFLEGCLAQALMNFQYNMRKTKPFRVKLKGLHLNERLVKKLLPEIQNKLEEYDVNQYYQGLEAIISGYFIKAGNNWQLSEDEISFYFVLGMNSYKLFKSDAGNEGGDDKNE